jgi:hypothetical protein
MSTCSVKGRTAREKLALRFHSLDLRKWQLKERLGRKWFGWPKKKGKRPANTK